MMSYSVQNSSSCPLGSHTGKYTVAGGTRAASAIVCCLLQLVSSVVIESFGPGKIPGPVHAAVTACHAGFNHVKRLPRVRAAVPCTSTYGYMLQPHGHMPTQ